MKAFGRCLFVILIAVTASFSLPITSAAGQTQTYNVSLLPVNSDSFPQVEEYVSVTDIQGMSVQGLTKANFEVIEDGTVIPDAEITAFQNTSQPLAIALVMDTSGSMKNGSPSAMQNSIEAANQFLQTLQPQDMVTLVSFADLAKVEQPITTDKTLVQTALSQIKAEGGYTALYDGIIEASNQLKNRSERRLMIILTDGHNTKSIYTLDEASNEAARWKIPVHTIGFGFVNQDELNKIARLTGGSAQFSPDSTSLQSSLSKILLIFREQYKIKYTSKLKADGKDHDLAVRLNYDGAVDEEKISFVAKPGSVSFELPNIQEGSPVGGVLKIAPVITAPAKTVSLDVSLDGNLLQSIVAEPFEYAWDTTTIPQGTHNLVVKVKDEAGNSVEQSYNVIVQAPIQVTLTNPTEGLTLRGVSKITANVTSTTSVARVEFILDGNNSINLQEAGSAPSGEFSFEWDTRTVPAGSHTLEVLATDPDGYKGTAKVNLVVEVGSDYTMLAVTAIILIAALALIIPLSLRRRKNLQGGSSGSASVPVIQASASPSGGSRGYSLVEIEGHNPGAVYPLSGAEISLGRKRDENDIALKGLGASRFQALIRLQGNEFVLFNLSPDNPVLVNGQPIKQQQNLYPGDEIQSGDSTFRFEMKG